MHYRNDRNTITLHFGKHNSLWSLDRQSIMALSVTFIMEINIILAECNDNAIFSYFNMKTGLNLRIILLIFYRLYNCYIKLAIWKRKRNIFKIEMKWNVIHFLSVKFVIPSKFLSAREMEKQVLNIQFHWKVSSSNFNGRSSRRNWLWYWDFYRLAFYSVISYNIKTRVCLFHFDIIM